MRYIRTKDGIYDLKNDSKERIFSLYSYENYTKEKFDKLIIKQADTIEELCDEFVYAFKNNKPVLIKEELIKHLALLNQLKYIYGAIWVKGENNEPILKSVAKMTNNGKLVLI